MRGRRSAEPMRRLAMLLGVGLFLLGGSSGQAARLLELRVERDGQVVLKGMTEDDSQTDPGVVWTYLKDASLKPVGEVTADPGDPLRATLTGNIRVAVLHVERTVGGGRAEASVRELRLVRPSPESGHWQLAPGEVERTAHIAGIQLPPPRWWFLAVVGGVAAVALAVAVVWFAQRRRHPGVSPPIASP